MKHHYIPSTDYRVTTGTIYRCDHPVYNVCTLYYKDGVGLAVVQQRLSIDKKTYWTAIDPWLVDDIYNAPKFGKYFEKHAKAPVNRLYPTVTVRQIMWALRMKPLKKEVWETAFDRSQI